MKIILNLCLLLSLVSCATASNIKDQKGVPGYHSGAKGLKKAPVSMKDLKLLEKTILLTDEDKKYLRMSKKVLASQVEQILDVWYGFVASNEHLVYYFGYKKGGKPNSEYLGRVRKRFARWILDTADANYDQNWLNYQYEIGRRHHRVAKNKVDNAKSVDIIHFRYLTAFISPITITLKPFLAKKGHSAKDVDKMHAAWLKSVVLQVTLWSYPYIKDDNF